MHGKRAVVLGGGGARGSYEIGVWKGLREIEYDFDIVTGTSVGALNGAIMVMGLFDDAVEFWENVSYDSIYSTGYDMDTSTIPGIIDSARIFLRESVLKGGIDYSPLKEILSHYINEETIRRSPIDFGIMTVEAHTMKPRAMFKEDMEKGRLIDYCLASAACFPVMKPYEIDGVAYIDGGYNDTVPIRMAIDKGATEIVAVDLGGFGIRPSIPTNSVKIININSHLPLGNMFNFDGDTARKNIQAGYFDTLKVFNHAEGGRYTFPLGEYLKNYARIGAVYRRLVRLLGFASKGPSIEGIAKWRLYSALKGRWGENFKKKQIPLAAAECAAEVLGVPYLVMYTASEFNEEILKRVNEYVYDDNNILALLDLHSDKKTPTIPPISSLKLPDRRAIMFYIAAKIKENEDDKSNLMPLILTFSPFLPIETIGAFYIAALEKVYGLWDTDNNT